MITKRGVATVFILVILMGSAFFYFTQPPHFEVKNGYGSLSYSLYNLTNTPVEKKVSGVAILNGGEGRINLTVTMESLYPSGNHLNVDLCVVVRGAMPYDLTPSAVKLEAREMENSSAHVDFDMSFNKYINVTPWRNSEDKPGAYAPDIAYIGGIPNKGDFVMITHITWRINDFSTVHTHTLRIISKNLIFTTEVLSTVNVTLDTTHISNSE